MSRRGNQTDVTLVLTVRAVIGSNREQTCVFALRTRVRLQTDRVITSNFAKILRQALNHVLIALGLVSGRKGVNQCKLGPSHRDHLDGCIELHRA